MTPPLARIFFAAASQIFRNFTDIVPISYGIPGRIFDPIPSNAVRKENEPDGYA